MKTTTRFYGYLVATILALFATSCEEEPIGQNNNDKNLEVSITSKELDAKKGSFVINVDSNTEWTISTSAEWITLSGSEFSGAAGVLVTYTANEGEKSRSAKLNIGYKGDTTPTYSIIVTQKGSSSNSDSGNGSGNEGSNDNNGGNSGNDDNNQNVAKVVTVAEFLAAPECDQLYKLTGEILNPHEKEIGFFFLEDLTGYVFVKGLYKDGDYCYTELGLQDGDIITIVGKRSSYENPLNPECVKNAEYISHQAGEPNVYCVSVGYFLTAEEDEKVYELSGKVSGNITSYYGNFDLTDSTGTVYIYGLVDSFGDKVWDELGIKEGDDITVRGTRRSYNGTPEMINAVYMRHTSNSGSGDEGNDNNNDDNGNSGNGGGIVTNSGAKHAGWAELPAEEDNDDYYYAYHMIPDKGNGKVRNFAVCYSADLGCPVWVASPMHSYYTQKNTSRSDAYGPDPDIPSSIQVHKRDGYTRGHMLGSSDRLVSAGANKQAFYYSNIAPQLQSGFNTGGGVWNNLEEHCDGLLCADTLYMVNGCYWENKKTSSSGTVIPTHYYKVLLRTKKGNSGKWVVNCSASELQCVVFMVKHNSSQHKVEPHTGMLMSVSELEQMTGHTFFPNVPNAPKDTYKASDWGL